MNEPKILYAEEYTIRLPHKLEGDEDPITIHIKLPGLVLFGIGRNYYLWAVKTPEFEAEAQAFHAPLPNVYEDGKVCFGANDVPAVEGTNLNAAWDLFWRAPFSEGATNSKSRRHPNHICEQLYRLSHRTRKRAPYPLADLVPYSASIAAKVERVIHEHGIEN